MANLRDIRKRIRSVKNTGKITRAMQLVAASRMKKAQEAAISARPYAQMLAEILSALPRGESGAIDGIEGNVFLTPRPVKNRGVLVLSTDRGLVGGLNSNLFRFISTEIKGDNVKFVAVGRKAAQFLARTNRNLIACSSISDRVPYHEVRPVIETLARAYIEGEVDTIEILFPRFINNLRQEPTHEILAPVPSLDKFLADHSKVKDETANAPIENDTREMLFEPSQKEIIERIVELYIRREIYQMMLEAKASEQSSRMVAMKTATDNAKDLEGRLTLNYNKARQAAITQELVELGAASAASS
ncbi:MAG TPA: ATP synthase F1 subunit gamma [Opitutales bacterium]|nr:ATP synthase F1 subunit gamma [Opitutales bacterium]